MNTSEKTNNSEESQRKSEHEVQVIARDYSPEILKI